MDDSLVLSDNYLQGTINVDEQAKDILGEASIGSTVFSHSLLPTGIQEVGKMDARLAVETVKAARDAEFIELSSSSGSYQAEKGSRRINN